MAAAGACGSADQCGIAAKQAAGGRYVLERRLHRMAWFTRSLAACTPRQGCAAIRRLLPTAADASIWLFQFIQAMRDERGDLLRNAHVLGFFRRISRCAPLPSCQWRCWPESALP